MIRVTVDVYEKTGGVPSLLEQMGVLVDQRLLPVGDYIVGPQTIVERKSVLDLHATIACGRFWPQMGRLRDAAASPFLFIEGSCLWDGPIQVEALRVLCLATSDLGIAIIRTDDVGDTARWLYRLASRRQEDGGRRDRPHYSQRPKRARQIAPAEQALAAAPHVSVTSARALLHHFGSLRSIVLSDRKEWLEVPGIGKKRADSLASMIDSRWHPDQTPKPW